MLALLHAFHSTHSQAEKKRWKFGVMVSNISLGTSGIVGYYDMQDCTCKVKIEKRRQALPFPIQNGETPDKTNVSTIALLTTPQPL